MKRYWLGSSLAFLLAAGALAACSSDEDANPEVPGADAGDSSTAGTGGTGGAGGAMGGGGAGGAFGGGGTGGGTAGTDSGAGGDATTPVDGGTGGDATTPVDGGTGGDATTPVDSGKDADATAPVDGSTDADATAPVDSGQDATATACVFPDLPACTGLTPIAMADACTKYAEAACAFLQRCNSISSAELATCQTQFAATCTIPTTDAGGGVLTFDGANAACCVKHMAENFACTSFDFDMKRDPACDNTTIGTIATSAACYKDDECAGNAYCDTRSTCPGTCKNYILTGNACTVTDKCADNGSCVGSVCVAPSYSCQDAPCTKNGDECFAGYYCKLPAADAGAGTCQALPATSQPCGMETGFQCTYGVSCNLNLEAGFTGTCGALGTAGAACLSVLNCEAGFYCAKADGGILGTCTAVLAPGADCDPAARDYSCGRGLVYGCQPATGKCATNPAVGDPCVVDNDTCQNSWCDGSAGDGSSGICAAEKAGGAACESGSECKSGDCTTLGDGGKECAIDCKRP
jgi:hypothetical protein